EGRTGNVSTGVLSTGPAAARDRSVEVAETANDAQRGAAGEFASRQTARTASPDATEPLARPGTSGVGGAWTDPVRYGEHVAHASRTDRGRPDCRLPSSQSGIARRHRRLRRLIRIVGVKSLAQSRARRHGLPHAASPRDPGGPDEYGGPRRG